MTDKDARKNRRRAVRRPVRKGASAACYRGPAFTGRSVARRLLDVSETGARLTCSAALAVGEEVQLELLGPAWPRPVKLSATVVWRVEAADGTHCVGVDFAKYLPFRDVQDL